MHPFSWRELVAPQLPPWEVIFRAAATYVFVMLLIRLIGRKEWTRTSVMSLTVLFLTTIALRMTMVGNDSSITSGFLAFATLVIMDWLFSALTRRSARAADVLSGPVRLLVKNGVADPVQLRKARLTEEELLAHARLKGLASLGEIAEARLERSGKVSFIARERVMRLAKTG